MKIGPVEIKGEEIESLYHRVKTIPGWIIGTVVTVLISLFLFWVLYDQGMIVLSISSKEGLVKSKPSNTLEWKQKEYVTRLSQKMSLDLLPWMKNVYKCYPSFRHNDNLNTNFITVDDADAMMESNKEGTERYDVFFSSLKGILNYFDGSAMAYYNGVADKPMFDQAFGKAYGLWYARFKIIIDKFKKRCYCDWPSFEKYGNEWMKKNNIEIDFSSKSGANKTDNCSNLEHESVALK